MSGARMWSRRSTSGWQAENLKRTRNRMLSPKRSIGKHRTVNHSCKCGSDTRREASKALMIFMAYLLSLICMRRYRGLYNCDSCALHAGPLQGCWTRCLHLHIWLLA